MRGLKLLIGTTALLAGLAVAPAAKAQVVVGIGIGIQPVCQYGYYDYAPYACSPYGFYGPGYFYNGIFLGMGPWAGWGYGHGWGGHRFVSDGGGSYRGHGGEYANHSSYAHSTTVVVHNNGGTAHATTHVYAARPPANHTTVVHTNSSHTTFSHTTVSHASAPHAEGSHPGGSHPGGGGHADDGGAEKE